VVELEQELREARRAQSDEVVRLITQHGVPSAATLRGKVPAATAARLDATALIISTAADAAMRGEPARYAALFLLRAARLLREDAQRKAREAREPAPRGAFAPSPA
jgi:hypothetical protein